MLRLTLAQMRRTLGRLVAAGVAIALGAAFVTATLLGSNVMSETTAASLTAEFARSDLVVTGSTTAADAEALARVPEGAAVHPLRDTWAQGAGDAGSTTLRTSATAPAAALESVPLVAGTAVAAPDEIALTDTDAARLGVGIGDRVTVTVEDWTSSAGPDLIIALSTLAAFAVVVGIAPRIREYL